MLLNAKQQFDLNRGGGLSVVCAESNAFNPQNPSSFDEKLKNSSSTTTPSSLTSSSSSFQASFFAEDLEVDRVLPAHMQAKPASAEGLKFGHTYADHMLEVDFSETEGGWSRPRIGPLKCIELHPGSKALHYAVQLFEGMKAYRGVDNQIRLFRPEMNVFRMRKSAERASLPDFDSDELVALIRELVRVDRDWVPTSSSCTASLYIRPAMIGLDPTLDLSHCRDAKLYVLTGPAGAYFPNGFKPISLLADSIFVRSYPGGVGAFKLGCNYAPTILLGRMANEMGCEQVLWLFDTDEKLTEAGTMNIFVYWLDDEGKPELVTPPLTDGLILPGVTRDSLLAIAREWNAFKVSERYPTMAELKKALAEKRVMQVFGSGTACVVCPVGRILHKNKATGEYDELMIPTMTSTDNLMQRLYDTITGIQYGRIPRPDWVQLVD